MVPIMTAVAPSTTHTEMTTVGREEEAGEESLTSAHCATPIWPPAHSPMRSSSFLCGEISGPPRPTALVALGRGVDVSGRGAAVLAPPDWLFRECGDSSILVFSASFRGGATAADKRRRCCGGRPRKPEQEVMVWARSPGLIRGRSAVTSCLSMTD